ncbi:hypothetical protein [Treponema pectinovorum]|uniref:hypothetical protein n=1 Tax=Treponema pectinovorum TaxID=164 RepID=UPI0011F1B431|nr:hypothetical protein [Treponema pectinovorum]
MNSITAIKTNDNSQSCSRAKQFIGIPITGEDGKLLNGEYKFNFENEEEPTVCRFINGLLDGNVYDAEGIILERLPALEYSFGGTEYWTKGTPEGFPAVVQNFGYYEEDWTSGTIQEIRNEVQLLSID